MPKFSALVHVSSDAEALDQTLSSLECANDPLVVVEEKEKLRKVCRKHHARIKTQIPGVTPGAYAMDAYYDWILVLGPGEKLTHAAEQALCHWRDTLKQDEEAGYKVPIESPDGQRLSEFRLVNRRKINWTGDRPPESPSARDITEQVSDQAA